MTEELYLETERLAGRVPEESMAALVLDFYTRNRDFLEPYEPERAPEFYTLEEQSRLLRQARIDREEGRGYSFWLFRKGEPERAIGYIALNNIVRGAFQSCFLGCKMDGSEINKGYMTEAVKACAAFAFGTLGLHRIEGNIMPRNRRSLRVAEKCGFREEGLARAYLRIHGVWEDHIHMVRLADDPV